MNRKCAMFQSGITLLLSLILFVSCGSDPYQEGEKAFNNGKYSQAIIHYSKAKQNNPKDKNLDEKIALSIVLHGRKLYQRNHNIKTLAGNFERSRDFVPEDPSEQFKKQYSELLFELGQAYNQSKPNNDIQKEEFLNNSIAALEDAIFYNPDNDEANNLFDEIKASNFQKMLDKGINLYNQAKKERNYDLFFSAEYYLKKASNYNPFDEESKKYLVKTRKQTLKVLDSRAEMAIGVVEQKYLNKSLLLDLEIQNNKTEKLNLDVNLFSLVDSESNTYGLDKEMMEKLAKNALKNQSIAERQRAGGIIAFKTSGKKKIDYLMYTISDDEVVKKYFP